MDTLIQIIIPLRRTPDVIWSSHNNNDEVFVLASGVTYNYAVSHE